MKKQKGFTLIEIMISLLLGLIVIGGAISIYIGAIRGSADVTNSARLNYDLDSVMQLMTNDIRRAGFSGGAVTDSDSANNVFTQAATNIQIRNLAAATTVVNSGNCILYSYDVDDGNDATNPELPDGNVNTNEYYGFRLNGTDIEMRLTGTTNLDCADGNWEPITTSNKVNITRLAFSFTSTVAIVGPPAIPALPATSQCLNVTTGISYPTPCVDVVALNLAVGEDAVETRQVNIIITGEIDGDDSVEKIATGSAKVRNNRVFTK